MSGWTASREKNAVAGIRAGRRGGFGAVVGVDRTGDGERLREAGAHWVVKSLGEVKLDDSNAEATVQSAASPPSAFERWEGIARRLSENPVALFLDYDGTLTPIVSRPELAVLSDAMRAVLRKLAWLCPVAVVSGRDLRNVEALVGLKDLIYAGSHGFDISGPRGLRMELAEAKRALPELDAAEAELALRLEGVRGAWVERKRYSVAVHFRAVSEKDLPEIEEAVRAVLASREGLRKKGGKKVVELSPDLDWDKGAAVLWAIDALGLPPSVVPLYIGDDLTDEDAFKVLSDRGLGIFVGQPGLATHARYFLRDPGEVQIFLDRLAELLGG
jgi:trehalose 6-phosphate phosphatase